MSIWIVLILVLLIASGAWCVGYHDGQTDYEKVLKEFSKMEKEKQKEKK
jgi:membrane protein required for beta-lactamase induction